jgi:hypothetical protein
VQHATNRDRVCQQSCNLSHGTLIVDCIEFTRVQHGVPICQVDLRLIHSRSRVFKLGEEASRHQVVIILVDLSQLVADLQMCLVVVGKMILGTRDRNAAIGTFIADMCGRKYAFCFITAARWRMAGDGELEKEWKRLFGCSIARISSSLCLSVVLPLGVIFGGIAFAGWCSESTPGAARWRAELWICRGLEDCFEATDDVNVRRRAAF